MFQVLLAIIYLAFISLGLPDSMLGAAWPSMNVQFGVPISYAGIISALIAFGTIISSLQSDRLTLKFGTGKVMVISVCLTALALFGFSITNNFWLLCLWAIPYGLGGGSVDASLNNYVALHYKSHHMSWLHCMWGVGAATGPYIMGYALTCGMGWSGGYRIISLMQIVLTIILFLSLPLWKNRSTESLGENEKLSEPNGENKCEKIGEGFGKNEKLCENECEEKSIIMEENRKKKRKALSLKDVLKIKGAKQILICFFCYCAVEQTAGLWASSYLNIFKKMPLENAAFFGSMFYIGITIGRAISGFLTFKLSDLKMIRLGQGLILLGIIIMLLPLNSYVSLVGLIFIGLGCAPIYPCIIHSTPDHFGKDKSQAVIGVQMAFAYMGTLGMPPLFGIIANAINVSLLPIFLLVNLFLMVLMHEILVKVTK